MLKKLYFTIAFIFICVLTFAQCPSGYMELYTQSAVNNFKKAYPSCVSAVGLELMVNGSSITNLDGLSNLSDIRYLYILNTKITSLATLANLKSAGTLYISNNSELPNLTGMTSLRHIGHLNLSDGQYSNLVGLEDIETIKSCAITNHQYLNNISVLSDIPAAGRTDLYNNPLLSDCAMEFICAGIKRQPGLLLSAMVYQNGPGCNSVQEISAACGTLPVTLAEFRVSADGNVAQLTWTTMVESNSSHFEIERSKDGRNWVSIGRTLANGNSASALVYSFSDKGASRGYNYYRLKMIDLDNTFAYSTIQGVKIAGDGSSLFPNPVADKFYLPDYGISEIREVSIFNGAGERALNVTKDFGKGISVGTLSAGIYVAYVYCRDGSTQSYRFFKK